MTILERDLMLPLETSLTTFVHSLVATNRGSTLFSGILQQIALKLSDQQRYLVMAYVVLNHDHHACRFLCKEFLAICWQEAFWSFRIRQCDSLPRQASVQGMQTDWRPQYYQWPICLHSYVYKKAAVHMSQGLQFLGKQKCSYNQVELRRRRCGKDV